MKTKKRFLKSICYTLILWLLQACSSSAKVNAPSTGKTRFISRYFTPQIDGNINEWGQLLSYDRTTKCIYAIANDASSLYIAIRAADRTQQMKIIDAGLEIWLDANGKKNKSVGIKFPLGAGAAAAILGRVPGNDSKEMREEAKQHWMTMELTGFKSDFNGQQNIYSNSSPVKPVIEWDGKGNMDYELKIPFSSLDEAVINHPEKLYVGIFINGMEIPARFLGGAHGVKQVDPDRAEGERIDDITRNNYFWTKYTIASE